MHEKQHGTEAPDTVRYGRDAGDAAADGPSGHARAALCARGLDDIFDPELRASIAALIEDVAERGDAAVCDALARFDGIDVTPEELRVTADEIAAPRSSPTSTPPSTTPSPTAERSTSS